MTNNRIDTTKKRILIVEDEAIIAIALEESLEEMGYKIVGRAKNGDKALDLFASTPADLVLLDISLKGTLSGIDLAKIIRRKYKMPFIFITSYSDPQTLQEVKETLPYAYIVKPFTDSNLKINIELALHKFAEENEEPITVENIKNKFGVKISERGCEILRGLNAGLSYQEISDQLFISINTVKSHQKKLYQQLNVNSKLALMKLFS